MDTAGQLQGQASLSPSSSCQIHAPSPHSYIPQAQFHNGRASPCHQSQQHASSAPCQGCYSHSIPWAPGKKGFTAESPAQLTLLQLQVGVEGQPLF